MTPQIFRPSANTIARASLVALGLLAVAAGLIAWLYFRSPFYTRQQLALQQPVQFSHKHHVSQLGIDCRYCHMSVEKSTFADFPPTHTCMTCHSQIWVNSPVLAPVRDSYSSGQSLAWTRVYDVPDYVYFNHEIHVNKGIGCESCHGRIDQQSLTALNQPLSMIFCVSCHNNPAPHLRPRENVFDMGYKPAEDQAVLGARLMKEYNILPPEILTNCWICHR